MRDALVTDNLKWGLRRAQFCARPQHAKHDYQNISHIMKQPPGHFLTAWPGLEIKPMPENSGRSCFVHGAQGFDCGKSHEYLHLGCLFRLRDLVAHRNSRFELVGSVPNQIEDCVRQRVIPAANVHNATGWHTVLLVAAVASWAHKTAASWLRLVKKLVPQKC